MNIFKKTKTQNPEQIKMIHSGVINTIQLIHTISGKHCYFITFVFPSLRSGTRDVRSSSSLLCWHPSSHTASGKCYCNLGYTTIKRLEDRYGFNTASGRCCCNERWSIGHDLHHCEFQYRKR